TEDDIALSPENLPFRNFSCFRYYILFSKMIKVKSRPAPDRRIREEKEEALHRRYAAGELGLDINNTRERLQEKGLRYVDANDL
ncbi:MAG: hypothetical protein ABWY64_16285, partial [Tardiphaga sp.]